MYRNLIRVDHFYVDDRIVRLIGALLMEMDEKWSSGKRYLDMTEYHEWKKQQQQAKQVSKVTPIR